MVSGSPVLIFIDLAILLAINQIAVLSKRFFIEKTALRNHTDHTSVNRSKGHGSVCTTSLSRIHRHLHLYCRTPPTSLRSDNAQKPAQINGGTDTKTMPASQAKGQCAGNTLNTLILANRSGKHTHHAWPILSLFKNTSVSTSFIHPSPHKQSKTIQGKVCRG